MEFGYEPAGWYDLFRFAGGLAGGLLGLVFVGLSRHLAEIVRRPEWRGPAVGGVGAMASVIFITLIILIPQQTRWLLSLEIASLGGVLLIVALRYIWRVVRQVRLAPADALIRVEVTGAYGLILLGGISVALGRFGGLYWVAAGVLVLFLYAFSVAWKLLMTVGEALSRADAPSSQRPLAPSARA